ncbi:MAG: DUF1385 domain-containing protein [Anaerolineae bacterium]|nr:DUF1385 domain-containing protein [Anaerolineae bacterium]
MPHPRIEHARARAGRIGRRMALAARLSAAVLARAQQEAASGKPAYWYGGQAIIEGVMMRGRYVAAIAVRNPKQSIVIKEVPLNAALYRGRAARLPFVRGLVLLWDALVLGTSALMWSADVALEEEEDIDFSLQGAAGFGLVIFSLALGIGLFFVLPAAVSAAVKSLTGLDSKLAADLIEGVIKLALLIGYIWAIGFMQDVKRLFGYHGAEHKTINAYEAGATLTPDEVDRYPIQHPRCGTAFLLTLVVLSVLIHIVTGRPDSVPLLLLSRVALILPIAGTAYEVIRFTAKHQGNPVVRQIVKPNLALQSLTTRRPDRGMLEVGIAALERVLAAERAGTPLPEARISEAAVGEPGD